jgi:hypothetical protein
MCKRKKEPVGTFHQHTIKPSIFNEEQRRIFAHLVSLAAHCDALYLNRIQM